MTSKPLYTVQAGRSIYRDGKPCFSVHKSPVDSADGSTGNYALSPVEADKLTHLICALLNADAAKKGRAP